MYYVGSGIATHLASLLLVVYKFFGLILELTCAEDSEEALFNDNIGLVVLLNQSHNLLQVRELLVELALTLPRKLLCSQFELKEVKKKKRKGEEI